MRRSLHMRCITSPRTLNWPHRYAKKPSAQSRPKVGARRQWGRCGRWIVSSASACATTVSTPVGPRISLIGYNLYRDNSCISGSLNRKAIQPLCLADGTYIPKGTLISIATIPLHHDEELHDNPWTFDPWRFETLRDEDKTILKHQLVTTSTDYVACGHGKHAW